jgi:hypothetical protein
MLHFVLHNDKILPTEGFFMFKKLLKLFTGNEQNSGTALSVTENTYIRPNFSEQDEEIINTIIQSSKLDFFYINEFAKDIFLKTANLFSDDIVNVQSTVIDNATRKIEEILTMLTTMDDNNFNMMAVKEVNLLTHYYSDEIYKYIKVLNERKDQGLDYFNEYDRYIEAGNRFIAISESGLKDKSLDPLQQHLDEETKRNIERFKEKVFKLKANKLYHSQSLLQISVIHSISEKLYEQMNEIIFIVIPVLKNKSSINLSIDQMKNIKKNLLSIKSDKDKKMQQAA